MPRTRPRRLIRLITLALVALLAPPTLAQDRPVEHTPAPGPTGAEARLLEALAAFETELPTKSARLDKPRRDRGEYRELPEGSESLPTLRFRVVRTVTVAAPDGETDSLSTEEVVTRSPSAVSVAAEQNGFTWLFLQNPVHPERATGYLTDLGRRMILEHEDTDLRKTLVARDWLDVLVLQFDLSLLDRATPTGQTRIVADHEFERYILEAESAGDTAAEFWWSDKLLLPLEVNLTAHGRTWRQRLHDIEVLDGSPDVLGHPRRRRVGRMFTIITLGDWYEQHLGCDCKPAGWGLPGAVRRVGPRPPAPNG